MQIRILCLVVVTAALLALDPPWLVIEWGDLGRWLQRSRPEDAVAAVARQVAVVAASTQVAAVCLVYLARVAGSGRLEGVARRLLLPILRTAAPIALVAGTALPSSAAGVRLPIAPPPVAEPHVAERVPQASFVLVEPGDSMWTIAADHAPGEVTPFWRDVVEMNRTRFADVDLIHPGERVLLPPESA